jgi:hypothetical protein
VTLQVVRTFLNVALFSFLVIKETQFKSGFCLSIFLFSRNGNLKDLFQVLESHRRLSVTGVDVSKHLVSFALLFLIVILDSELQELLEIFDGMVMIVRRDFLLNERNLLIALGLLVFVIRPLCHI